MRKISQPFRFPNRKGYYVRWFENGRRKHKQLNTLKEAEAFRAKQYMLLNSDVYSSVSVSLEEAINEYIETYDVRGLAAESKKMARRALDDFVKETALRETKYITQRSINLWILSMKDQSPYTINKALGRLRAFLAWANRRGYQIPKVDFPMQRAPAVAFKCPSNEAIAALLKRCPSEAWRVSVLLYLTTGLRKNDLPSIPKSAVNIQSECIDTSSLKTGKVFMNRPFPSAIVSVVKDYLTTAGEYPFKITNARKEWDAFCGEFTHQMLRKTFSTLMQMVGSLGSAQRLLEHSSARVSQTFYSDTELIDRWKVNQLPVSEWLKSDATK